MPRLNLSSIRVQPVHSLRTSSLRYLSSTPSTLKGNQNSTPGWSGRPTDDHVVKRKDKLDAQSDASQTAMSDKAKGKEGSQGISEKDEGNNAQKAKEEFPEAPDTIGMNDERGGKAVKAEDKRLQEENM